MTGGQSSISIRHQVANVTTDAFAIIPVGTNGDFQMDVVGENAAIVYVRCIGYFICGRLYGKQSDLQHGAGRQHGHRRRLTHREDAMVQATVLACCTRAWL